VGVDRLAFPGPGRGCCAYEPINCVNYHRPFAEFPSIELWKGELASVTSVKYIDQAGVEQTVDPSVYSVDKVSVPGRLLLAYGQSWPSPRHQWDAVKVRYVVGTADTAVPEPIKQAILILISQMWKYNEIEVTGTIVSRISFSYDALVGPYRIMKV
jgi:uncharacterized phiE125 gp8 family phage protein